MFCLVIDSGIEFSCSFVLFLGIPDEVSRRGVTRGIPVGRVFCPRHLLMAQGVPVCVVLVGWLVVLIVAPDSHLGICLTPYYLIDVWL